MDAIAGPGLGAVCALGSALTWAVIALMVRALTPAFNSVVLNALRTTVAGALLVAWTLIVRGPTELTSAMSATTRPAPTATPLIAETTGLSRLIML